MLSKKLVKNSDDEEKEGNFVTILIINFIDLDITNTLLSPYIQGDVEERKIDNPLINMNTVNKIAESENKFSDSDFSQQSSNSPEMKFGFAKSNNPRTGLK
jgi:hypothetical protein